MELNPTNAFAELLLDFLEAQYDGDLDAGMAALVQTTGLTEEEVEDIVNGAYIVDDENLLAAIIAALPDADDNDLELLVSVATAVDEEDRAILQENLDAAQSGEEIDFGPEEMAEPEEASYSYGYDYPSMASFGNVAANARISELENRIASFEMTAQFGSTLDNLNTVADQLVATDTIPASYKTMLLGNFSDPQERLARFSQLAENNGVDPETMLFATHYALDMLANASQFVEFRDYSLSDEQIAVAHFSAGMDAIAESDVKAIFGGEIPGTY